MHNRQWVTPVCTALLVTAGVVKAAHAAAADDVREARVALGFDPHKRCPDVRTADEGDPAVALVRFRVGPSGVPSEPSIKSSSGSAALDAAATNCVMRLRFQPATSWGDGNAVASWQQLAWRWTNPQAHQDDSHAAASAALPASAATPAGTATAAGSVSPAAAATAATAATATTVGLMAGAGAAAPAGAAGPASPGAAGAEVRVCVDAAGKLAQDPRITRSSGDSAFDEAAVQIARSGSGYYRPPAVNGKPAAGCVQLAIRPEKG